MSEEFWKSVAQEWTKEVVMEETEIDDGGELVEYEDDLGWIEDFF